MKLTKKSIKQEVETIKDVCEVSRDEFSVLSAKVAARLVMEKIEGDNSTEALLAGLTMARLLAEYCAELELALFDPDPTEDTDKKEEN